MSARWVRRVVVSVCVVGVAGMVGGSIAERVGLAITSGVVAAIAVVCLIVVTAAAGPTAFAAPTGVDETAAADLEHRVQRLVAAGADEAQVRALVGAAVRLYRRRP
jgi:hypothetical protein